MPESFCAPHLLSGRAPDTPILVALSGGADSVALLAMLRDYAGAHGTPLRAAHVNHGIRGAEAIRDREFCVALCARWEIPLSVLDADVPRLREEHGGSMEEVARQVRYEFFERVMAEYDIPLLATAHHADDQLETVLLRLTRGTGPDGLCGIPPVRALGEGRWVIRPLLGCEKAALEQYCRAHALDYVVDSTNEDISYARNRIRREVIPHLRAINPSVTDAAARLCGALRTDTSYLTAQTDAFVRASVVQRALPHGGTQTSVSCTALGALPEALRRRVLARMMRDAGCPQPEERFLHQLSALAERGREVARLSLPGGVTACREGGMLCLGREAPAAEPPAEELVPDLMHLPLTVRFGDFLVRFTADREGGEVSPSDFEMFSEIVYKMSMNTALNSATIKGNVSLRTRRAGDRFLWRGHHRRVKKLCCDLGVPLALRDRLPLLCDGDGILLLPGIGVRDGSVPDGDAPTLWVSVRYDPIYDPDSALADRNIRNQQKEETDEE